MLHGKVRESHVKAVSVRTCPHHSNSYRAVGLHPSVAHHGVFLVVKRIENLYRIFSADSLYPYKIYRLVEGDDTPVGCMMGHHGAEIEFSVDILYSSFDIVLMIDANHHAGLVEARLIIAGHLHLGLKLPAIFGIIERSVINGKAIVRDTPVITFWSDRHGELIISDVPLRRFIEPVHLFQCLCRYCQTRQQNECCYKKLLYHICYFIVLSCLITIFYG